MIIEIVKDTRKRYCAECKKRINKGDIIVKYKEPVDSFGNTRMWFAHIDCLISKLNQSKKAFEDAYKKADEIKKKVSNMTFKISRCYK